MAWKSHCTVLHEIPPDHRRKRQLLLSARCQIINDNKDSWPIKPMRGYDTKFEASIANKFREPLRLEILVISAILSDKVSRRRKLVTREKFGWS
jgi:hypothetical protein